MQSEVSEGKLLAEANSFVVFNLNETGVVEEFIEKLRSKIKNFNNDQKNEFTKTVIRKVDYEKAWHDSLCGYDKCAIKDYFDECLKELGEIYIE